MRRSEGLPYSVPDAHFGVSYSTSVFNCLKFLTETNRSKFVCANEQYPLLDGNAEVTWSSANCATFLNRFVDMGTGDNQNEVVYRWIDVNVYRKSTGRDLPPW
jgi:hypothetical protein